MTDSVRLDLPVTSAGPPSGPPRPVTVLGWLAAAGIGAALLIMIVAAFTRQDWMSPPVPVPVPHGGLPFEARLRVPKPAVVLGLWTAALLAAGGLWAGLVAARRGARPPMRLIAVAAVIAVVLLAVSPPAGSTDALDYAAYGRLALLGHNPYVASPVYLRLTEPGFGLSVPSRWQQQVSLYGPAATIEQYLAAWLGGASMARVVFWLKLWNALAFGAVAYVADRVLRTRPAMRLRAHLLWTLNPLLLWDLIASGHVDLVAAAAGILGLLAVGRQPDGLKPGLWRVLTAGALVGLAADIKINYLLFAAGLAWTLRKSPSALLTAAAGALAVLVPTYAWLGTPAFRALFARTNKSTEDAFYRLGNLAAYEQYLLLVAGVLCLLLAVLLLRRMPPGDALRPALRPVLALSVAWLFIWPYQLPWYDAMIVCVLVLYPATRLDWLVLARLTAATMANMPGEPNGFPVRSLRGFDHLLVHGIAPFVLLVAAGAVVIMAVTGQWGEQPDSAGTAAVVRALADRAPTGWPGCHVRLARRRKAVWRGAEHHPVAPGKSARGRRPALAGTRLRGHVPRRSGAG
jgi:hypothetical protein